MLEKDRRSLSEGQQPEVFSLKIGDKEEVARGGALKNWQRIEENKWRYTSRQGELQLGDIVISQGHAVNLGLPGQGEEPGKTIQVLARGSGGLRVLPEWNIRHLDVTTVPFERVPFEGPREGDGNLVRFEGEEQWRPIDELFPQDKTVVVAQPPVVETPPEEPVSTTEEKATEGHEVDATTEKGSPAASAVVSPEQPSAGPKPEVTETAAKAEGEDKEKEQPEKVFFLEVAGKRVEVGGNPDKWEELASGTWSTWRYSLSDSLEGPPIPGPITIPEGCEGLLVLQSKKEGVFGRRFEVFAAEDAIIEPKWNAVSVVINVPSQDMPLKKLILEPLPDMSHSAKSQWREFDEQTALVGPWIPFGVLPEDFKPEITAAPSEPEAVVKPPVTPEPEGGPAAVPPGGTGRPEGGPPAAVTPPPPRAAGPEGPVPPAPRGGRRGEGGRDSRRGWWYTAGGLALAAVTVAAIATALCRGRGIDPVTDARTSTPSEAAGTPTPPRPGETVVGIQPTTAIPTLRPIEPTATSSGAAETPTPEKPSPTPTPKEAIKPVAFGVKLDPATGKCSLVDKNTGNKAGIPDYTTQDRVYVETGKGATKDLSVVVEPQKVAIVQGFVVDGQGNGTFKVIINGGDKKMVLRFRITDGAITVVDEEFGAAELCNVVNTAVSNRWAHRNVHIPPPWRVGD